MKRKEEAALCSPQFSAYVFRVIYDMAILLHKGGLH